MVKVAVIMILMNFKFEAFSYSELEFDYGFVFLLPKEGTYMVKTMKEEENWKMCEEFVYSMWT